MKRFAVLLVFSALLLGAAIEGRAQDAGRCDALAGETVPIAAIEVEAALVACAAAMTTAPNDLRLVHQYARALEGAGRIGDAARMYGWAAAGGFAPAREALGRLPGFIEPQAGWDDAEREALADAMAALAGVARRWVATLPPDPSDPIAIVTATGTDAAALLAWISDHTQLIPYAGVLRGARGVISDRAGNSLDRALALADLLAAAGQEVRLARAMLTEAQAEVLLTAIGAPVPVPVADMIETEGLRALLEAERERLSAEALTRGLAAGQERQIRFATAIGENTDLVLPTLLAEAAPFGPAGAAQIRRTALAALRDHFWIQVRDSNGWVDLDPEADIIGPISANETMAVDAVPNGLRHSITVRVVVEIQAPSGTREETLLTWTAAAADLGDAVVSLWHASDARDGVAATVAAGGAPDAVLSLLNGTAAWTPMLSVGETVHLDRTFTRDGVVRPADPNAYTSAGRGAAAGIEAAANLLGVNPTIPEAVGVPTAEWIEIEVTGPGEAPRIERRTIFDIVGPVARAAGIDLAPTADQLLDRALRLAGVTDLLILAASPSAVELAATTAEGVAAIADTVRAAALLPELPALDAVPEGPRLALALRQLARARLAGGDAALAAPNVFAHHLRFTWSAETGATLAEEIDIVFNDVWVSGDTFAGRVRQGAVDTNVEAALVPADGAENAAVAMIRDLALGNRWGAFNGVDRGVLPPDFEAVVAADLARGYVVVVPLRSADRFGWWRIDPASGRTLGMLAEGGGAVLSESQIVLAQAFTRGFCLASVGMQVSRAFGGVGPTSYKPSLFVCSIAGGLGVGGLAAATTTATTATSATTIVVSAVAALTAGVVNALAN